MPEGAGLGIIGRNGAGKTTLLKLISRVTWPTSGKVRVAGRVVSLIELGAGFHPELTGRENVYLGAGLFGLTRKEIDRQFDAIVAVRRRRAADRHADEALLVRSLRAPRLRASRSTADPDIVLVDEVLSVGDAAFRRRALESAARADRRRQDRAVHLARHVERAPAVQRHPVDGRRAACAPTARPARSPSAT